ncbi:MAG: acyl-CoA carboxylase subunit epsilon [Thermoleophilia bacterium]|nr:acyl-CoA carboxylase subunit epsilon [Thermoleophilia bacterium]
MSTVAVEGDAPPEVVAAIVAALEAVTRPAAAAPAGPAVPAWRRAGLLEGVARGAAPPRMPARRASAS